MGCPETPIKSFLIQGKNGFDSHFCSHEEGPVMCSPYRDMCRGNCSEVQQKDLHVLALFLGQGRNGSSILVSWLSRRPGLWSYQKWDARHFKKYIFSWIALTDSALLSMSCLFLPAWTASMAGKNTRSVSTTQLFPAAELQPKQPNALASMKSIKAAVSPSQKCWYEHL